MTRLVVLLLFAGITLGVVGCGDSSKGKSELPPNAKQDIGQPIVLGGGSAPKSTPGTADSKKGKLPGVGAD